MSRTRSMLSCIVVAAVLMSPVAAPADPPGFSLTIEGPVSYQTGVPVTFTGRFALLGAVGLDLQSIHLRVDDVALVTTVTTNGGNWSVTVELSGGTRHVRAVADPNTPLETQSEELTIIEDDGKHLVINEVDYDQPGTDAAEFIEIYNPSIAPRSLDGLAVVLVNGASSTEYLRISLSGSLASGSYAVVASSSVMPAAGSAVFLFGAATNNVHNGAPDGIALFDTSSSALVDALSYEGSVTAAIIDGIPHNLVEGTATTASDNSLVAQSLGRAPNGVDTDDASADWAVSSTPTPGEANV